jgi:dipeptidyl aminopeptidase/acylaminoacyl peptidase
MLIGIYFFTFFFGGKGLVIDMLFGRHPRQSGKSIVPNDPEAERQFIPLEFVDATFPPVFAVHSDQDSFVPVQDSAKLVDRLKAVGVEAELVLIKGGEHGIFPEDGQTEAAWERAAEFLERLVV